jgi:protoheme IX farnesyltransferase
MLPTGKRQENGNTNYIIYNLVVVASLLPSLGYTGQLFIGPYAAVLVFFFLGLWMLFLRRKIIPIKNT